MEDLWVPCACAYHVRFCETKQDSVVSALKYSLFISISVLKIILSAFSLFLSINYNLNNYAVLPVNGQTFIFQQIL